MKKKKKKSLPRESTSNLKRLGEQVVYVFGMVGTQPAGLCARLRSWKPVIGSRWGRVSLRQEIARRPLQVVR